MSNWISTKDGLPKKEGEYLTVTHIYENILLYEVLHFRKIRKKGMAFYSYDHYMYWRRENPIAWMPIEPYKGEA